MASYIVGGVLLAAGLVAATNSLGIVKRAVRVWPRQLTERDGESVASTEFLVRFVGLMAAMAGAALIAFQLLRGD